MKIETIAFDADDTLWHNEPFYQQGKDLFGELFKDRLDPEVAQQIFSEAEIYNIRHYGYGLKSFVLSMVESALELGDGQLDASSIQEILAYGKEVIHGDLKIFDRVESTLADLAADFRLIMITKGDLFEQSLKIEKSGLADYFKYIEVVPEKTSVTYRVVLDKLGIQPEKLVMVGNSLRSDIMPILELGSEAIYIPYEGTWAHETILDRPLGQDEYHELPHIGLVPDFIRNTLL